MHKKGSFFLAVIILIAGLLPIERSAWADQVVYKFGVVPQFEANKLTSIWLPILEELEKHTGFKFQLKGSARIPVFEQNFFNGDFDLAYMNPYHSRLAFKSQGYTALVRDGGRQLYGVLVVRKESGIDNVQQLAGEKVAFPAPNALGASLIMRADLEQLHHISIKPSYVQTHSSVYLNVALGQMAAGGGVMSTFNNQPENIRDRLKVIYETRKIAPHPVVAHPRVPVEHQERITKAFLAMGETEKGRALLEKIPVRKIITATPDDYEVLDHWGLENYFEDVDN